MPGLSVRDLTVTYSSGGYTVRPIDGLSFDVADGTLALLLGPSGCGKTTLLSCLAGILTPTSGSIRFGDDEIAGLTGRALMHHRRSRVGVVFQAFNLVPSLSARENVEAPMLAAGVPRREARARAEELLERVGLADRMQHRPGDLSGGQQQRVAIARSLVSDPPLVLADEPTAHLDYVQVEEVIRLIRELAAPGRVVVVSTHDERMLRLADQVVEMVPSFARQSHAREPQRIVLTAGEEIFHEGSRGDLVYVVERGLVDIVQETAEGELVVAKLGPGEYFGEMGPMFEMRRSATARAAGDSEVTAYTLEQFRDRLGIDRLADLVRRDHRPRVPAKSAAPRKRTAATKKAAPAPKRARSR